MHAKILIYLSYTFATLHNILPDDYLFHVKVLVKLTKYSTLLI